MVLPADEAPMPVVMGTIAVQPTRALGVMQVADMPITEDIRATTAGETIMAVTGAIAGTVTTATTAPTADMDISVVDMVTMAAVASIWDSPVRRITTMVPTTIMVRDISVHPVTTIDGVIGIRILSAMAVDKQCPSSGVLVSIVSNSSSSVGGGTRSSYAVNRLRRLIVSRDAVEMRAP